MMRLVRWVKGHTYCFALTYWLFYLIAFFTLEHLVVPKFMVQCFLDEKIPFCEWFIIPYFLWFPLLIVAQLYFLLTSKTDFQNLCFLMFGGMTICLMIYAVFPNGLDLRQEVVNRNLLCKWVNQLYTIDTATNVCPSIHVASTVAINHVVHRSKQLANKKVILVGSTLLTLFICFATLFIKQHSIIDVLCGVLLCEVLYWITYQWNWRGFLAHTKLKILL